MGVFSGRKVYTLVFDFGCGEDGINTTVPSPMTVLSISTVSFFMEFRANNCCLLLPVVHPPCVDSVVSAPCQSIWSQNLTPGVPSNAIAHSQSFLDSTGIHLILIKMTLCWLWDCHSSSYRSMADKQTKQWRKITYTLHLPWGGHFHKWKQMNTDLTFLWWKGTDQNSKMIVAIFLLPAEKMLKPDTTAEEQWFFM